MNLKNVGGVFWVTLGGAIISIFLVFMEMLLHVAQRCQKHENLYFKEALKEELSFYFQFSGMTKPVTTDSADNSESNKSLDKEVPYGWMPAQENKTENES